MYKAYLFNSSGLYQAPIYLQTEAEVLSFAFRYKDVAPKIMVTESDESVLEIENGELIFPELDDNTVKNLSESTLPMPKNASVGECMNSYNSRVADFVASKGKDKEIYSSMIQLENDLFALAARDNINLSKYGWKSSGIIEAELDAAYS